MDRCVWAGTDPLYVAYHDTEWGVPVHDDQKMFEFLILESFQAGLSWITILRKRENFRKAFNQFDAEKIAAYDEQKVASLLQDSGIIRNKAKINASIKNAQAYLKLKEEMSFCDYWWKWVDGKPLNNNYQSNDEIPAQTALSDTIAKDLKKRGFSFVGSTTVYAHMQAAGIVNDHMPACFRYQQV